MQFYVCNRGRVRVVCVYSRKIKRSQKKVGYERHSFSERIYINVYIYMRPHCSAITTFSFLFY